MSDTNALSRAIKAVTDIIRPAKPAQPTKRELPHYTWQFQHSLAISYNRAMPVVKYLISDNVNKEQIELEFNTENGKLVGVIHQSVADGIELLTHRQVDDNGTLRCKQFSADGKGDSHKSAYDAEGNIVEDEFSGKKNKAYHAYVDEGKFMQVFAEQMLSKPSEGEIGEIKKEALSYIAQNLSISCGNVPRLQN
jgi:hypothetical protein